MAKSTFVHPNGLRAQSSQNHLHACRGHGYAIPKNTACRDEAVYGAPSHHRRLMRSQIPIGQVCHTATGGAGNTGL